MRGASGDGSGDGAYGQPFGGSGHAAQGTSPFGDADGFAAALAIALLVAWRANVRDRAQLAADLATAKQSLAQADARQHDRDAQLARSLASLAAEKRSVTTPAQIVRDLPRQIPLPAPITLQSGSREISGSRSRPAPASSTEPA